MEIHENSLFNNSKEEIMYLDKIDRSITNSIQYAEKKCRKLNTGNVPYTPKISEIGYLIKFWNTVLRKKKGCNISSKHIQHLARKMKIQDPMQLSLQDCEQECKVSVKKYHSLKKMHNSLEQYIFII